jgi:hypothetical protein
MVWCSLGKGKGQFGNTNRKTEDHQYLMLYLNGSFSTVHLRGDTR